MDHVQQEPTFEESIKQVMQTLPPPIRSYLAQGKYSVVAQSLMAKYGLRIDQGGVLEREIMLLLMGIESPEEFNQALVTEAGINQQMVSSIVQDVNTQIFSPLREEMRKGVEAFGKKPPQIPSVMPARQPIIAPTPTSHFHLENKLPPRPAVASGVVGSPPHPAESAAVRPIPPRPSAQTPVAASALSAPVPVLPQQTIKPIPAQSNPINILNTEAKPPQQIPVPVRPPVSNIAPLPPKVVLPRAVGAGFRPPVTPLSPKPMDSNKLLEDHEEPHIELNKSKAPSSSEGTPLQQALRTVLPRPAVASGVGGLPPPNLPGAMPPPDIMLQSRSAFAASKVPQTPVKPYSADPYREPIE